jgi:OFA family oxalate/formate antiporter-like MFS transporter
VIVCLLALLLRNPPKGFVAPAAAATAKPKNVSRADRNWPAMLKTPQFYMLWVMFILASTPGLMLIANGRDIAAAQAPGWVAGVVLVMTLAIFNTVARVVAGFVSDRIGRTTTMVIFFLAQAVNMLMFKYYVGADWLIFGAAATGLFYGAIFTLFPAATADFYGVKNLGVNYGIVFTAFGVAGATGAILGGKIRDLTGNYDRAYIVVACMLGVAAVMALLTRAPKVATESAEVPVESVRQPAEKSAAR